MITLKLKYEASDEARAFILKCRRQYSSALRFAYNRVIDGWNGKQIRDAVKFRLNNVGLMDSYMAACIEQDATAKHKSLEESGNPNAKYIFGGRKNFIRRCKGLISRDEFKDVFVWVYQQGFDVERPRMGLPAVRTAQRPRVACSSEYKEVRLAEAESHRRNITRGGRGRGRGVVGTGRGNEASMYQSVILYIITYYD